MNCKGFHWKLQENISHGGFPQLDYRRNWQELSHFFSPGEYLGYIGLLNICTNTSGCPPKHIEDSSYILNDGMSIELISKFPLLGSHFESWMEGKEKTWTFNSPAHLYKRELYSEKGENVIESSSPTLVWHFWLMPFVHKSHIKSRSWSGESQP